MVDIINYVASVFSSFYRALDVQIFPDINLSLIEIMLGIVIFGVLIKFIFTLGGTSNFSIGDSIRGIFKGYTSKNSSDGYTPKHGSRR